MIITSKIIKFIFWEEKIVSKMSFSLKKIFLTLINYIFF